MTNKIKPTQRDQHLLTRLQHGFKFFGDDVKRQGLIVDDNLLQEGSEQPKDWDVRTILTLENHAVLAGLAAKQEEVIRDKLLGGKKRGAEERRMASTDS